MRTATLERYVQLYDRARQRGYSVELEQLRDPDGVWHVSVWADGRHCIAGGVARSIDTAAANAICDWTEPELA